MRVLALALVLLPLAPIASASCAAGSDMNALPLGGVYYLVVEDSYYGAYYDVSVWRESNGHAGLQRYTTYCPGGATVAADREL